MREAGALPCSNTGSRVHGVHKRVEDKASTGNEIRRGNHVVIL